MYGLGADDLTQVMGIGTLGEVRQGPDGNLYQWVQGVDGLGNPFGFWRALRRFVRRRVQPFLRRALPIAQQAASFIPGVGPAVAAGIRTATPLLRQAGVAGYDGFAGDEALGGLGSYTLGEIAQGPDGNLYQWVQGVDGLGNPFGFWRALRRFVRRRVQPFLRRALPIAQQAASFIPGVGPAVAAGITAASPFLRKAGVAGYGGLGALYQALDGSLYQMAGYDGYAGYDGDEALEGDDELGYLAEEELRGYAGDEALDGDEELGYFAEDELRGYGGYAGDEVLEGDEELGYFAADDELRGYGGDEELGDMDGYIFDPRMSGLEAYVPDVPAGTRPFTAQTPETWRAIW
jgi:hypothetical protein